MISLPRVYYSYFIAAHETMLFWISLLILIGLYALIHLSAMQVVYKTLNPLWNQTLEFPDTGSPLILHVRDHNAVLPTSSIGHCVVEYEKLPPNQTADKWIRLQGVKSGEIHVQITRKIPELPKKFSLDTNVSASSKAHTISAQVSYDCLRTLFVLLSVIIFHNIGKGSLRNGLLLHVLCSMNC